jgi:outer membrane murein-binding lipoprotein Lpp
MSAVTRSELFGLLEDPSTRETVKRLLDLPTEPVAEAVQELRGAVKELAVAQARTDRTVKELATEVKELATEVKELAAAQARTDQSVFALRREVGTLSDNVGFGLEELASIVLPAWLEREEGVTARHFNRRFFQTADGEEEIDVYADGDRAGTVVPVVVEVKSRIYSGDVKKYAVKLARIAEGLPYKPLGLMFGFVVHPAANDVARELGLRLVASRPSV